MTRTMIGKVMWIGRATVFAIGLAVTLALMFGVATAALAAVPGDPFRLGQLNAVNTLTRLVGNPNNAMLRIANTSAGPNATALDLEVAPGRPPMRVNSGIEVRGLNVDSLDGKNSNEFVQDTEVDQIGVNGLVRVNADSAFNSDSSKVATANCPAGKVLVGTGYRVVEGQEGTFPNERANVVVDVVDPGPTSVLVVATEDEALVTSWGLTAKAICATAP